MYSTVAPMMGLPLVRQTQRLQAKECKVYPPPSATTVAITVYEIGRM